MTDLGDAAAVELRDLTRTFGTTEVLRGLDLDVPRGSITALLGPSGCGKTTVLRIVAGLETLDGGTVSLGSEVVSGPGTHVETEQRRVGMIFQNGALFPHLSVARNVGYGLERSQRRGGSRVDEMLDLVGLAGFGDRSPDSLSGGQAQRVALARALAPSPSVVLMDEPFSNLDAVLRTRLRREVADVARRAGVTVLLVTHDRDEAFSLADRVAVMRDGRIVQVGAPRDVYRRPVDRDVASFVGEVGADSGVFDDSGLVRPEDLELVAPGEPGARPGVVRREEFGGPDVLTTVELDDGVEVIVRSRAGSSTARSPGERVAVGRRAVIG